MRSMHIGSELIAVMEASELDPLALTSATLSALLNVIITRGS